MKILIMFFFITLGFACQTEEVQPETLEGTWELRHILGVQVAGAPSQFKKGNGSIIRFVGNKYERIEAGKVLMAGAFTIIKDSAEVDGNKYANKIIYDDQAWGDHIKITGKQMLICTGTIAADGTTSTYEKIK